MQDRLKKKEKSLNQIQNGLMHIRRILVKKGQRTDLSQTKEIQNIVKDILQNKMKEIEKNTNMLQNILAQVKKRKRLFEKGLQKIAKMQNLSQNENFKICCTYPTMMKISTVMPYLKEIQKLYGSRDTPF